MKFIKIQEGHFSKLYNMDDIKFIFREEEVSSIQLGNELIHTSYNFDDLSYKLLQTKTFKKIELNKKSIRSLKDNDSVPVDAVVNINKIRCLSDNWEGRIEFIDGDSIEASQSYEGTLLQLGISDEFIL
ncbi:hypothetical protein [Paenibacillus sp. 1-18]|uniref:hypothetical protein n=1 Tax=Paenibacillus sp. 1-18 TaxID=1333846 RepID=UPI00046FD78E|nr:hypothetical protein [Paenibacillus sp. 1-18]